MKYADRIENPGKKEKRRPAHGFLSNVGWAMKRTWGLSRPTLILQFCKVPLKVASYALALWLPPVILDSLETSDTFSTVALTIVVLLAAQLALSLLLSSVEHLMDVGRLKLAGSELAALYDFLYDSDPYLCYDPTFRERLGVGENALVYSTFLFGFVDVLTNVICFILFGAVLSKLSLWVTLLLAAGAVGEVFMHKWNVRKERGIKTWRASLDRRERYITWNLPDMHAAGKDIRVYRGQALLEDKENALLDEHTGMMNRVWLYHSTNQGVGYLLAAVRDIAAYAALIRLAVAGEVTSGEFVLYFSAITQLSGTLHGLTEYWKNVYKNTLDVSDLRELYDTEGKMNHGTGVPLPVGRPLSVEFRHVSYTYPGGTAPVIRDVSFVWNAGEKIAMVGLNGCGKTTLTLLLCGILLPDEGEVLIDGHPVSDYNRDELFSLFSLVPQHACVLPTSVAENIALCDQSEIDMDRLQNCLARAGIADVVNGLKNGVDTMMDKDVDPDGAAFSGGEMQKLLLARALYREAPMLILDEPTAALDPIAEDAMYRAYDSLTNGTTSVYISHRLASTRFCDRIFLLEDGHFTESGTHEQLMALGGHYRHLFDVQSQYYKEGGDGHEEA